MNLELARKYVWDSLRAASIAEEHGDTVQLVSFVASASECLTSIIDRSKQGMEVKVAENVLDILKDGFPTAAFNYVSDKEVHYWTGSLSRLGWRDL